MRAVLIIRYSLIIAFVLMLADLQMAVGQQPTKVQEFEQFLNDAIKNKDNGKASYYAYELAKLYTDEKQSEKAIQFLNQSLTYSKKANDPTLTYLAYQKLGLIYTDTKKHSKALDNFEKALSAAEGLKKPDYVHEELLHIASSYSTLGKFSKSIESVQKALSLAIQQNDVTNQQNCYMLLEEYYKKDGNSAKAKEHQTLYTNIIQSKKKEEEQAQQQKALEQQIAKAGTEKKNVTAELEKNTKKLKHAEDSLLATKYSLQETSQSLKEAKDINEKRQLQIDLLNKDKELADLRMMEQEATLKNERLIRKSIIAVALLVAALIIVLVRDYRKKLKVNKKLDEQNKSIKSSINYAKRIQEAMLPKSEFQKNLLPDSFVLLKPRDSVSGDFYWFTEIKSWYDPDVVFAAADCTGHGVPGAFMSLIGINALNGIISGGIAEPNLMLHALDTEIRSALQQEKTGNNDGMDIALCIYRKQKNIIEFSGAKNPLVYIQNKQLFQVKGDVHPIGGSQRKKEVVFKKHIITIDQPTMIYLFSDGYRDQFGGKNNSKFMSKNFTKLLLDIHHLPLAEQKEILDKKIEEWRGNHPQTDDILVMGIKLDTLAIN
ncbi:MAG TPA: SpoIIE family protein phosphatase [Cyclobacteriaceae bacterium]|jgi:serine phosphatase RsbU (regulator of sigma subunit)|nr:SpoIIE family protein phosphatase [Cyclobacteriaceae bacterium]